LNTPIGFDISLVIGFFAVIGVDGVSWWRQLYHQPMIGLTAQRPITDKASYIPGVVIGHQWVGAVLKRRFRLVSPVGAGF
jgi:hypothetical protein